MYPIIKIENLSKQYRLGNVGTGTLSHDLNRWWANLRGKEDPFLKIGETNTQNTKGESDYVWALKDINLEVMPGEVLGIIGKNGAGKSTLLKLLSRVTAPTTGNIKARGRIASLLEVGTGFHPELTGRENIFLNGAILGMNKAEIRSKFDEIVAFAEVERYIDTPVKRYSSGMYVRLAFTVAAHLESEILIVDEVLAVGDAEFQKKCLGKMGEMSKGEGRTVLFVSHNMAAINSLCERAILLNNGFIEYEGMTQDVTDKYLSHSIGNQHFLEWKRPAEIKMQYDEYVDIKGYSIIDSEGNIIEHNLLRSGTYFVTIDVTIKKQNPNLVFFLSYFTSDENLLFVSDIFDDPANKIDLTVGEKTLMTRIPVEILNNASYKIELSCVIHYTGWPLIGGQGQMLEFKFHNNIDNNRMQYSSVHPFTGSLKPGILSPVLPWFEKHT